MDLSFAESRERSPMRTVDTRLRGALPSLEAHTTC